MEVLSVGISSYETVLSSDVLNTFKTDNYFQKTFEKPGGISTSVAKALSVWEISSYLSTAVGSDFYGEKIRKSLENSGVKTDYVDINFERETFLSFTFLNRVSKIKNTFYKGVLDSAPKVKKYDYVNEFGAVFLDATEYHASINAVNKYSKVPSFLYISDVNRETLEVAKLVNTIILNKTAVEFLTNTKIDLLDGKNLVDIFNRTFERFPSKNIIIDLQEFGTLYELDSNIKLIKAIPSEKYISREDLFSAMIVYGKINNFDIEKTIKYANVAVYLANQTDELYTVPTLSTIVGYYNNKFNESI